LEKRSLWLAIVYESDVAGVFFARYGMKASVDGCFAIQLLNLARDDFKAPRLRGSKVGTAPHVGDQNGIAAP
jgi:hypothetical protein